MRKIFNLFAIFTICVLLFAACNIGKSKSKTAIGGAFNGVITARVENGDTLNSIITNLHVAMGMNNIFNNTSSYTNGGFTFTLPETPDSEMEWFGSEMSGFPSHYNISDRETNYITFYEIYGANSNGARIAKFQLILNESEWESVYISFWYVDRDVNVDGMILKKGWNTVQTTEYFESGNVEWKTASINSNVKWRFEEMYFYEEPNNPTLYDGILYGDLSAFAGTWVDVHGQKMQIKANGRLQLIDNNLYYFSDDYEADVSIFPAGVEFVHWSGTVITDTTRDRVFIQYGSERTPTNDDVYYREGELQSGNNVAAGDLGGRVWHFQSGERLYFFQHFRELTTVFFHSDGNVHITSEETSLSVFGKWKITDDGRLEIKPDNQGGELNIPEVLYFSYQIRGNILTLTDNNPNFGNAGDEGTYYEVFRRGR